MNEIETSLKEAIREVVKEGLGIDVEDSVLMIEIPKDSTNGDYATNVAMRLAKVAKRKPSDIADIITKGLKERLADVDRIEIAGPGFINFFMKKEALANVIDAVIDEGDDYGKNQSGDNLAILLEYVSANPTGILHLGHARGAAWGDSVARLLKASGYNVLREYYINDAGNQMEMLGLSVEARYREALGLDFTLPEDGYHGQDVKNIGIAIANEYGDKWLNVSKEEAHDFFKNEGYRLEMKRIRDDLAYYRCEFDSWISEKKLVEEGRIDKVMDKMIAMGLTYEADGAIWFKSSVYGDDKDRVLKKSDGYYTYLTPDIANHLYKFERGYQKLVNIWGADHHGYIPRMKAAIEAMGYPKDSLEVDIVQMVRLVEDGKEVKMSKRTGNAVTIRELCEDIGVDAARYFFLSKALDTHMDFDLGLARKKTNENPVFYAQYAHARIASILRQADTKVEKCPKYDLLVSDKETELLKYINEFPSVVADAARDRAPNKICNYIQKLAQYFHSFYSVCRVNDPDNMELTKQRLALVLATKITLKNALYYLGVEAPEEMKRED